MEEKYQPSYGNLESKPGVPGGLYDEERLKQHGEVRSLSGCLPVLPCSARLRPG
jgi:hypothetical protein